MKPTLNLRCHASDADAPFACPHDAVDPVTVSVMGDPQGKGRPRAFRRGPHLGMYTPQRTRTYEGLIQSAALDAMGKRPPIAQPCSLVLRAVFPVPPSWSKKKRTQALLNGIMPAKKPDLDNIAKAWKDALRGVVYRDDAQIVQASLEKRYGPVPFVTVTVRAVP